MSSAAMSPIEQLAIKARILAKPARVQLVINILAVSLSKDAPMDTDEQIAHWLQRGYERWQEVAPLLPPGMSESEFAGKAIEHLRADKTQSWGKILREGTN